MLDADISRRVGDLTIELALWVASGETVALLGPNGAGKTSIVRILAGLLPLERGHVTLDGLLLDEPANTAFVPAEQRRVGVVFQEHLLFPRMDVLANVAFGLRARGVDRRGAEQRATEWLRRLGMDDRLEARPSELSGGEAQRVALARALAIDPVLLLLDEPLAALDASTRAHVRAELRHHLETFAGARVLVTHDPLDAIVLADRLVIVEHGTVTQVGAPADVTARPASRFVADLAGINLLGARPAGDHTVRLPTGAELTVADPPPPGVDDLAVAIRPQAVALHRHQPEGSPRNAWPATVVGLEADRDRIRVTLDGAVPLTAEVTPAAVRDLGLRPGSPVWAAVKAVDLTVYER